MGKTALAAALALRLPEEGYEVLASSTDPLPSLARVLGLNASARGLVGAGSRLPVYEVQEFNEEAKIKKFIK